MQKAETKPTKQQLEKKRFFESFMGGALISVTVQLFEPYTKFAKEYLAFFGSKDTPEVFYMKLIYNGLERLHRDLTEFVHDIESPHFIDGQQWYEKHSHVTITSDQPEDEDC